MWNPFKKITYQSDINGIITIGKQKNTKALYSGGVTQSGGEIAPMWDEVIGKVYSVDEILRQAQDDKERKILILGVGGGSVIQAIRKHDKKAIITGIEIDPVMIQIAKEQFGLEENSAKGRSSYGRKNQQIIIADAIQWVKEQSRISRLVYDTIVVDLYIGRLNPPKARTKEFLKKLRTLVKPEGIILYNAHFQKSNKEEYESFRKLTDGVFSNVEEVFSYPLNHVLLLRK